MEAQRTYVLALENTAASFEANGKEDEKEVVVAMGGEASVKRRISERFHSCVG